MRANEKSFGVQNELFSEDLVTEGKDISSFALSVWPRIQSFNTHIIKLLKAFQPQNLLDSTVFVGGGGWMMCISADRRRVVVYN